MPTRTVDFSSFDTELLFGAFFLYCSCVFLCDDSNEVRLVLCLLVFENPMILLHDDLNTQIYTHTKRFNIDVCQVINKRLKIHKLLGVKYQSRERKKTMIYAKTQKTL